jgi:trans-aconitate methyltransferase
MQQHIAYRAWWRILRAIGLQQASWNSQFEQGQWCRGPRSHRTLKLVSTLCDGGKLIEFGCGEGSLPFLLPEGSFSEYWGFDISSIAIARANERNRSENRSDIRFQRGDMARWDGTDCASLILAEECLYYLTPPKIERFLGRCSLSLAEEGVILVIVHSAIKHAPTLDLCGRCCPVIDSTEMDGRMYLTLGRMF